MSLGYNPNRPVKTTNLPGSVGNSIPRQRIRRSPTLFPSADAAVGERRRKPLLPPLPPVAKDDPPPPRPRASSAPAPAPAPAPPLPARGRAQRHDVVYGSAASPLVEEGGEGKVLLRRGERGAFVYPMQQDEETGAVRMRLKVVDPTTAQISLHWVVVYSGKEEEGGRRVSSFSAVP